MVDKNGKTLTWILIIALIVPIVVMALFGHPGVVQNSLVAQLATQGTSNEDVASDTIRLKFENKDKQAQFRIYLEPINRSEKLHLSYNYVKNVAAVAIEIPRCRQCKEVYRHENRIIDSKQGHFYFGLNETDSNYFTVILRGYSRSMPLEIGITSLAVLKRNILDTNLFFVLLMLGISASLVVVGAIVGALSRSFFKEHHPGDEGIFLILGVFVFLIPMIPALLFFQELWPDNASIYLFALFFVSLITVILVSNKLGIQIPVFINAIAPIVIFYLVASVVVAVMLGFINGIALQEYFWSLVGKYRMFGGHRAHDNMFQYLNGLAIAEHKPFAYYYDTPPLVNRLFYGVDDRQVLSGAMFAVYRVVWGIVSPYAINTYGFYTIFGTSLTLLIVFPIYSFFIRFFEKKIVLLSLLVLVLTPYVLGNLYYTWFKILGGALILSGVYFLYLHPSQSRSWILAGVFWGLAANLHAGQAIVYPLLLVFFYLRQIDPRKPFSLFRSTILAAALTGTVIVTLLPWEIIKSNYYSNDLELFRAHFLGGEHYAGKLTDTIGNFMQRYTLDEQVLKRAQQFYTALRIGETHELATSFRNVGLHSTLIELNRLQYRYIAIMIYPLLSILLVVWLTAIVFRSSLTRLTIIREHIQGAQTSFYLALACVVWGLLVMFTKYEADSSSFVSPFSLIVINMFLITLIASASRFGSVLMATWAVVGAYKIALHYHDLIEFSFVL
ncbi:MAG: hypothetical protein OEQ39_08255 [Gammaproteobacteria bacterium]|nr:hypothetical protein [Gammaproteobacteria bacterium]MDH3468017.1 hypothetical protein [Gammaproteobacteria bacterium]